MCNIRFHITITSLSWVGWRGENYHLVSRKPNMNSCSPFYFTAFDSLVIIIYRMHGINGSTPWRGHAVVNFYNQRLPHKCICWFLNSACPLKMITLQIHPASSITPRRTSKFILSWWETLLSKNPRLMKPAQMNNMHQ